MSATTLDAPTDLLRERVRLYLTVLLCMDFGFYAWAAVSVLTGIAASDPAGAEPNFYIRSGITAFVLTGWAYMRFAKPGRSAIVATETIGTIVLCLAYAHMAMGLPIFGAPFAVLTVSLSLVLRSALVPSSVLRTAIVAGIAIGASAVLSFAEAEGTPTEPLSWLTAVGVAFGVVCVVTSRVIYGLHRQVSQAMRLGQYELVRKIGEGSMGVVYEATHVMLRRPTAIKLLPTEKAGELTVLRFEREVRQTSRLEHPNSVYIYDYGRTPDGQFYYAMEYLDGLNLAQLVERDGAIAEARAHSLLTQTARALSEAHALDLVHRDIKPANLMLSRRGGEPDALKVLDFGLVKALGDKDDASATQADSILGTPHYLSPEAIRTPDDVGPASDIYAVGALGFFLLTGRDVFEGDSVIDICSKHLTEKPESPSKVLGKEIDDGLEKLILQCLNKEPEDRPADGSALLGELNSLSLTGWSRKEACQWWDKFYNGPRPPRLEEQDTERTQLAVDVGARS